ncbi:MAG: sugar transferase, partial [bacterium]
MTVLQVLSDVIALFGAFLSGYYIWVHLGQLGFFGNLYIYQPIGIYMRPAIIMTVVILIIFKFIGLYELTRTILNIKEFNLILRAWFLSFLISLAILFFMKTLVYSRGAISVIYLILLVYLFIERFLYFKLNQYLKKKGVASVKVLIYGAGEVGNKLLKKLEESPKLGYHCVGFIDDNPQLFKKIINGVQVLGSIKNLSSIIKRRKIHRLFIALPSVPKEKIVNVMRVCKRYKIEYKIIPTLYDIILQKVQFSEIDGIPLIGIKEPKYSKRQEIIKRIFDVALSVLILLFIWPVFAVVSVLIKLDSQGPIIFRQTRIGKLGKPF